jgi:hypothetical protein
VSEQYDIQDVVGEGAYGVVWYVFFFSICRDIFKMTITDTSSLQFRHSQALQPKGRHQEDHSF